MNTEILFAFRLLCEAYVFAAAIHFKRVGMTMGPLLTVFAEQNKVSEIPPGMLISNDEARKGAMWMKCFGDAADWQRAKGVIRGAYKVAPQELEDLFTQIEGGTLGNPEIAVAVIESLNEAMKQLGE